MDDLLNTVTLPDTGETDDLLKPAGGHLEFNKKATERRRECRGAPPCVLVYEKAYLSTRFFVIY